MEDLNINTGLINDVGIIKYNIGVGGLDDNEIPFCQVHLLDTDNRYAITGPYVGTQGTLKVPSPHLWWPRSMSTKPGYMYSLEVII